MIYCNFSNDSDVFVIDFDGKIEVWFKVGSLRVVERMEKYGIQCKSFGTVTEAKEFLEFLFLLGFEIPRSVIEKLHLNICGDENEMP